ncbi:MAG: N-acetylneuraminate synthase family protein [Gammaproteobacteria bacterium]|nr:N-acetylneuraminate synthase family protein [Gammaproteobacteria bacterium]MCI0591180.1 N-acetylneuraminate synthase family protein [Gammaproteobacteria bacterium]
MSDRFLIGHKAIGPGEPTFLIAEIGLAHDGSLGLAHAFIDAAAEARADAVKFQTHIAEAESTLDEPFRVRFGQEDATRFDYWKRMEFSPAAWRGLADHAADKGLVFLSSAFSVAAVELLKEIGVPAWKVGSGEFQSWDMLAAMASIGNPMLLSTGMSTQDEIARTVSFIGNMKVPVALFQCTSRYPTPLEQVGLNVMDDLRKRFHCPVGLSDHSGTLWPALAAMARGANLIEVHLTFDRRMFGADVPASLTTAELKFLVEAKEAFSTMNRNPVDKDRMAGTLTDMRALFTKSVAPARVLPAGTKLTAEMLTFKKPGTGISAAEIDRIIGRRLKRDVTPNRLLVWEDLATD